MNSIEQLTPNQPLVFAHIGDLHITGSKEQNYIDLLGIVAQLETECADKLDFVYIPGDIADHGLPGQYRLVATALKMLSVPVYIIPGDHDMEQGNLDAFYQYLLQDTLPFSKSIKNNRCLFLDTSGPGKGGPDFRMGEQQLRWLERECVLAKQYNETILVFTHTYPDDLADKKETAIINALINNYQVVLVDMGHTHYNELANDGQTIFAATRSTGQIEEGPVGYSLVTVSKGIVSWRFKQLLDPFPFVMITEPADHRLLRDQHQIVSNQIIVSAMIFGARSTSVVVSQVGEHAAVKMIFDEAKNVWTVTEKIAADKMVNITVEAVDESGRPGNHSIRAAGSGYTTQKPARNGSDAATVGSWPENGIFGTQLGPNRNAKPFHKPKPKD